MAHEVGGDSAEVKGQDVPVIVGIRSPTGKALIAGRARRVVATRVVVGLYSLFPITVSIKGILPLQKLGPLAPSLLNFCFPYCPMKGEEPEGKEAAVVVWGREAGTGDGEGQVRPELDGWLADRCMCGILGGRDQDGWADTLKQTNGHTRSQWVGTWMNGPVGSEVGDGWAGREALGMLGCPLTAFHVQVWLFPCRQQRWNSPSRRVRACSCLWMGSVAGRLRGTERKRLRQLRARGNTRLAAGAGPELIVWPGSFLLEAGESSLPLLFAAPVGSGLDRELGLTEPGHRVLPLEREGWISPAAHCPHSCLPPEKDPGQADREEAEAVLCSSSTPRRLTRQQREYPVSRRLRVGEASLGQVPRAVHHMLTIRKADLVQVVWRRPTGGEAIQPVAPAPAGSALLAVQGWIPGLRLWGLSSLLPVLLPQAQDPCFPQRPPAAEHLSRRMDRPTLSLARSLLRLEVSGRAPKAVLVRPSAKGRQEGKQGKEALTFLLLPLLGGGWLPEEEGDPLQDRVRAQRSKDQTDASTHLSFPQGVEGAAPPPGQGWLPESERAALQKGECVSSSPFLPFPPQIRKHVHGALTFTLPLKVRAMLRGVRVILGEGSGQGQLEARREMVRAFISSWTPNPMPLSQTLYLLGGGGSFCPGALKPGRGKVIVTERVLRNPVIILQPHLYQARSLGSPKSRPKGNVTHGAGEEGLNLLSASFPQGFWALPGVWTLNWLEFHLPVSSTLPPTPASVAMPGPLWMAETLSSPLLTSQGPVRALWEPLSFCAPAPPPWLKAPVPRPTEGLLRNGHSSGDLPAAPGPRPVLARTPSPVLAPTPAHLPQRLQKQQPNRPRPRLLWTWSPSWGKDWLAATQVACFSSRSDCCCELQGRFPLLFIWLSGDGSRPPQLPAVTQAQLLLLPDTPSKLTLKPPERIEKNGGLISGLSACICRPLLWRTDLTPCWTGTGETGHRGEGQGSYPGSSPTSEKPGLPNLFSGEQIHVYMSSEGPGGLQTLSVRLGSPALSRAATSTYGCSEHFFGIWGPAVLQLQEPLRSLRQVPFPNTHVQVPRVAGRPAPGAGCAQLESGNPAERFLLPAFRTEL
ncbi:hypothetical protein Cadr_000024860 [Camelus dromedarius]|uniref:Uncharacterized protein n=1 Tax=Camelus dromedarius TaxID=9838 RepID=A0A5N4CPJ0_CAMDR|nr:hypothetical protein Cadr_000024860 [Camelus dromedarius]